jgi:tetratricopeptide (TPR) repeat protein
MKQTNNLKQWILLFLVIIPVVNFAQQISQLTARLITTGPDSNRVIIYNRLSETLLDANSKEAMVYADSALVLSRVIHWEKGEAAAYKNKGNAFRYWKQTSEAESSYRKCLDIAKRINDRGLYGRALGSLGIMSLDSGRFTRAIFYSRQADSVFELSGDHSLQANSINNIGRGYLGQGDYKTAIIYFQKSYSIASQTGNHKMLVGALINIGSAYCAIGRNNTGLLKESDLKAAAYFQRAVDSAGREPSMFKQRTEALGNIAIIKQHQHQYTLAISTYKKLLKDFTIIGDTLATIITRINIGVAQMASGDYKSAIQSLEAELLITRKSPYENERLKILLNLGSAYQKAGDFVASLPLLGEALELSVKNGDKDGERDARLLLSYTAEKQKDFKKAYLDLAKYSNMKDSLFTIDKHAEVAKMEAKFEMQIQHFREAEEIKKTESDKEMKELVNYLLIFGITVFILLICIALLKLDVRQDIISMLSLATILVLTECITLGLHPYAIKFTEGKPGMMLLIFIVVALINSQLHHRFMKFLKTVKWMWKFKLPKNKIL